MKIEGFYKIDAELFRVWELLVNPEPLQRCIPGCQSLEEMEDGTFKITLKTGVGTIRGIFNGSVRLEDIMEMEKYRMVVDGKGSPGFLKGTGDLTFSAVGDETIITYDGEVNVGGTIAGVGQRMIQSASKLMIGQFFTAIEAEAVAWRKADENGQPYEPPKHGLLRNTIRQLKKSKS